MNLKLGLTVFDPNQCIFNGEYGVMYVHFDSLYWRLLSIDFAQSDYMHTEQVVPFVAVQCTCRCTNVKL